MKLLSLRLDEHDANISYFDGKEVHYIKTERLIQTKRHAYDNLWEWVYDFEKWFNVSIYEIDEAVIVIDSWKYEKDCDEFVFEKIDLGFPFPTWKIEHHLAHALSDWMCGKSENQIVTDGFGDLFHGEHITWSVYKNYELVDRGYSKEVNNLIVSSLGIQYERMGTILNVQCQHNQDIAGKLMSLQSHGCPDFDFMKKFKRHTIKNDVQDIFDPNHWVEHKDSVEIAELTKLDWARSLHVLCSEKLVDHFSNYFDENDDIFYSGGVSQNVCWNTTLKNKFKNMKVIPHSGDEGLSLGGIEWLRLKNGLEPFEKSEFPYWQSDYAPDIPSEKTIKQTAEKLAQGEIVGWYQGHGEVGPRALGNRSILMRPDVDDGKQKINSRVKNREGYRPFGATVLSEYDKEFFGLDYPNPHMLYLGKSCKDLSAIDHIDKTCRHQTLGDENPIYRELIEEFYKLTGLPILLNTSLNRGGKPIAGSPKDAYGLLHETELDTLVIGDKMVSKS